MNYTFLKKSFGVFAALLPIQAAAQHPVEVERSAASGDFMAALVTMEKMPKRISTGAAQMAAARSAWALSLPQKALSHFEMAIKSGELTPTEMARAYLGSGIIELQEGRQAIAIMNAEKAEKLLPTPSPLRAQVHALFGQALFEQNAFAQAEGRYLRAASEGATDDLAEFAYLAAQAQHRLGKYPEASKNLEQVPVRHARAPEAIRLLATLAVEQNDYPTGSFWLRRGRKDFAEQFLDSWVDYVMVRAAITDGDRDDVRALRTSAESKFPQSDPWVALLSAAAEEYEWRQVAPKQASESSPVLNLKERRAQPNSESLGGLR